MAMNRPAFSAADHSAKERAIEPSQTVAKHLNGLVRRADALQIGQKKDRSTGRIENPAFANR
jgi:hypothetical protein